MSSLVIRSIKTLNCRTPTLPETLSLNPPNPSTQMPTILVLGATGYIGGAVLVGYKKEYPDYNFVALVRSESNIPKVEGKDTIDFYLPDILISYITGSFGCQSRQRL